MNVGGNPKWKTKFPKWYKKLKEVIEDPNIVILTDTELVTLVNSKLKTDERISLPTWKRWISDSPGVPKNIDGIENIDTEDANEFRHTVALARVNQKMNLNKEILNPTAKTAYGATWLAERKFKDLQLNQTIQIGNSDTILNLTVGNESHKSLIEGILQGETIDIDHKEVQPERLKASNEQ